VDPQVDGHQKDVCGKDVRLLGPAAHGRVAAGTQPGVEEGVEGVDRRHARSPAALHQQVHVEVDDLETDERGSGRSRRSPRTEPEPEPDQKALGTSRVPAHLVVQPVEVAERLQVFAREAEAEAFAEDLVWTPSQRPAHLLLHLLQTQAHGDLRRPEDEESF